MSYASRGRVLLFQKSKVWKEKRALSPTGGKGKGGKTEKGGGIMVGGYSHQTPEPHLQKREARVPIIRRVGALKRGKCRIQVRRRSPMGKELRPLWKIFLKKSGRGIFNQLGKRRDSVVHQKNGEFGGMASGRQNGSNGGGVERGTGLDNQNT